MFNGGSLLESADTPSLKSHQLRMKRFRAKRQQGVDARGCSVRGWMAPVPCSDPTEAALDLSGRIFMGADRSFFSEPRAPGRGRGGGNSLGQRAPERFLFGQSPNPAKSESKCNWLGTGGGGWVSSPSLSFFQPPALGPKATARFAE